MDYVYLFWTWLAISFVVILWLYKSLLNYEIEFHSLEYDHEALLRELDEERLKQKRKDIPKDDYRRMLSLPMDERVQFYKNSFNNQAAGILNAFVMKYEMGNRDFDIETTRDAIRELNTLVAATKMTDMALDSKLLNFIKSLSNTWLAP